MYEMLTGHRPFEAESKVALLGMQVTAPVPAMMTKCADCNVPLDVEVLVGRLLAKEATERIGDAREVIENIGTILSQLAAAGKIDSRFAPPPPSGFATNPGIISGISPSPPDLAHLASSRASNRAPTIEGPKGDGLLGGRAWILATGAGVLGLIVLVTAVVFVFKGRENVTVSPDASGIVTSADSEGPVSDPSTDDRVNEAIGMIDRGDYGSGIKKLEELGDAVHGREDVHRALLNAYSSTDRPKEAMREAGLVLKTNPNIALRDEVKLRVEIRDTALKEGSKDASQKPAVDEAFSLLENLMGTIGWDDLYDIGYGQSGTQYPKAAARARSTLAKGERAKMSPALAVAIDLHAAGQTCGVKNHFERAQKEGDERSLALLKPLTQAHVMKQNGFKKTDLLACLHDGQLARTISALEERLRAAPRRK
jgi:eukaryotic-like serine/threonine-protein kinase